jgi:D-alanyl-D-alanine carboxypeptidase
MASFLKSVKAWLLSAMLLIVGQTAALASAAVVVDVDSGSVLYQDNATMPWYPASTTKLMTVYVALSAVREGRITLDTPMMVSPRAARMQPSKMGFRPGTLVTLDNALKMLMVKSPNDIAVTVAEGVDGSVEAFANDMNVYAARLGLHESHFANPNGLPDPSHVSSARDMAMIGRALLRDFPEQRGLFGIGVLQFGGKLINNHNGLLGRYPGVDGMKTGFTCAAGYNIVASAERDGRHLLVVVMGAPSTGARNDRVATLFDRFFASGGGQSLGSLDQLPPSPSSTPIDNHQTACGPGRYSAIAEEEAEDNANAQPGAPTPPSSLSPTRAAFVPVRVFIGPVAGWTGRIAQAVGSGAHEWPPAPVRAAAAHAAPAEGSAPVEAAAPVAGEAPMALLGAAPAAPAAAATRRLVRAAPGLGLAVESHRARRHIRPAAVAHKAVPAKQVKAKPAPAKPAHAAPVAAHKRPGAKSASAR